MPQYPADPLPDRIRDYFLSRYNGNISPDDAAWLASLVADFIESNRLIDQNDYRLAARKCLRVLVAIDQSMVEARDAARQWLTISLALGLPSSCWTNMTEAALARQCGISKMAVSKQVHKFLASVDMEPAFRRRQISTVQKFRSITKGYFMIPAVKPFGLGGDQKGRRTLSPGSAITYSRLSADRD